MKVSDKAIEAAWAVPWKRGMTWKDFLRKAIEAAILVMEKENERNN